MDNDQTPTRKHDTTGKYIVDEHGQVVPCTDLIVWGQWMQANKTCDSESRCIIKQQVVGDYWLSTVFLGLDHNFSKSGPPILYETMIFQWDRRSLDDEQVAVLEEHGLPTMFRWTTDTKAADGHKFVAMALKNIQMRKAGKIIWTILDVAAGAWRGLIAYPKLAYQRVRLALGRWRSSR